MQKMKPNQQLICSLLLVASELAGGALASPTDTKSEVDTLTCKPDDRMGLYIGLEGNHVVRFTNDVALRAATLDPTIADVTVNSANELTLRGKEPGAARMVITDKAGKLLDVGVTVLDYNALQSTLHVIDPRIAFKHRVIDGASNLISDGRRVLSLLAIRAPQK